MSSSSSEVEIYCEEHGRVGWERPDAGALWRSLPLKSAAAASGRIPFRHQKDWAQIDPKKKYSLSPTQTRESFAALRGREEIVSFDLFPGLQLSKWIWKQKTA
ncbi:hypothetical protein H6P81_000053 [Aristolochia fimbriata]|uniref:Uncharacterized protein n=1 Tax=Aristolochia fimbriata TaxID=158543 RepID=A0AAV7F5E6_ARIFI|nr:hypothetical protein H6P81_000053 [Aristolochia fimbriata]